jgi:hypothetical protein
VSITGKEERGHGGHGLEGIVGVRAVRESAEVGVDHLLVALDREEQRDVDVDAAAGELLDRGSPAAVPGTLIITFGRSRRGHSSVACAIVASVSSATSGVHSNGM